MDDTLKVLKYWGLDGVNVKPISSPSQSTWDVDGQYILKRNTNADELARSIQFSELLTAFEIPVVSYIPTNDGQFTSPDGLYNLMTKLKGHHADFYEEPGLAPVMGRELARLHTVLAKIEPQIQYQDSDLLADWQNWIKPGLSGSVSDTVIDDVDRVFSEIYPKLPRQLIHRDVHLQNVLFDSGKLTGWLDFDISQRNVRIFDMAYLMGGQIHGKTDCPEKVHAWHSHYHNLLAGYDEINTLSDDERRAFPVLMIVIEFLFVCFWNGQGNVEQRNLALDLATWLYGEYRRGSFCTAT